MSLIKKNFFSLLLICILFSIDRLTKYLIVIYSNPSGELIIPITSFLKLNLIWNSGIAFGLLSLMIYVLSYTPLKRMSTVSIFIGAIPGAIPVMLGWVAATDSFGLAVGILFAIQFLWQFPHFISISWIRDEEYKKAGFKMMYGEVKGTYPAYISTFCAIVMTGVSILPYFIDLQVLNLSLLSTLIIFLLGIWFVINSYMLLKDLDNKSARKLMISSLVYLPLMQLVYVAEI